MGEKIVQTAGREQLGGFAPMFAHLNDDVLFGEVWNENALSIRTKCIITVVSLMASGITDSSLTYHLQNAKNHGVTKEEIAAIMTHAAMSVGWPKRFGMRRARQYPRRKNIRIRSSFPSSLPTTLMPSIFPGRAIWPHCPASKLPFSM